MSINKAYLDQIIDQCKSKYGNFDSPDFHFVMTVFDRNPYTHLVEDFRKLTHGQVKDCTSINDDVSFQYLLDGGREMLLVILSMVGTYAVVMRSPYARRVILLTREIGELSEFERETIRLIENAGVSILDEIFLATEIQFNKECVHLYRLLFTDTDMLPWT